MDNILTIAIFKRWCAARVSYSLQSFGRMATLSTGNLAVFNEQPRPHSGQTPSRPATLSRRGSVVSSQSDVSTISESLARRRWRRLSRSRSFLMSVGRDTATSKIRYENTYRLMPDDGTAFKETEVTRILDDVLKLCLSGAHYHARHVAIYSQNIVDEVKRRVKELEMPRYKIVCQVLIGSQSGQGIQMGSRALWNTVTDRFASASFENEHLYAVASVHAVYFE